MPNTSAAGLPFRWQLAASDRPELSGGDELLARAFGAEPDDVEVDFAYGVRPEIVTQLLANCVQAADGGESQFRKWTVARRMQGVLAIAVATGGARRNATADCRAPDCGQTMELDLDLERFRRPAQETVCTVSVEEGVHIRVRIPTGEDQLRFADTPGATPEMLAGMLIVGETDLPLRPVWLPAIESALSEHDDLTTIELHVACPCCGRENAIEFDLEGYLLRDFERRQRKLLDAVHRIACAYHWSEREILRMPGHRRDFYLDCIDREESR